MTTTKRARRSRRAGMTAAAASAAMAAIVLAVVGTGGMAASQVAPPVVTASATDGFLNESGSCSGPSTFSLDPATVSVSRTGDTTNELLVDLTWSGTIDASVYGAPEALVILAGETRATFEIDSARQTGTVSIDIGPSSDPSAPYDIGDPGSATARVLQLVADPICATSVPSSTTTAAPPGSPEPPAAAPVTAAPDYTG